MKELRNALLSEVQRVTFSFPVSMLEGILEVELKSAVEATLASKSEQQSASPFTLVPHRNTYRRLRDSTCKVFRTWIGEISCSIAKYQNVQCFDDEDIDSHEPL